MGMAEHKAPAADGEDVHDALVQRIQVLVHFYVPYDRLYRIAGSRFSPLFLENDTTFGARELPPNEQFYMEQDRSWTDVDAEAGEVAGRVQDLLYFYLWLLG